MYGPLFTLLKSRWKLDESKNTPPPPSQSDDLSIAAKAAMKLNERMSKDKEHNAMCAILAMAVAFGVKTKDQLRWFVMGFISAQNHAEPPDAREMTEKVLALNKKYRDIA